MFWEEPKEVYFFPEMKGENDCYFKHKTVFTNFQIRNQLDNVYKKQDTIWNKFRIDENFLNNYNQDFSLLLLNIGNGIAKNLRIEMKFDTSK